MIYESSYWKDDLLRSAADLRRRCTQKRWSETSIGRLEQRIMIGFYTIRRLRESRKISDRLRNRSVPLQEYGPTGRAIRHLNRTDIDRLYRLDSPKATTKPLDFVANQIIHSYVFTFGFNENGHMADLFFSSDKRKSASLFELAVLEIASIFDEVGNNYPSEMKMDFDPVKGKERIHVG